MTITTHLVTALAVAACLCSAVAGAVESQSAGQQHSDAEARLLTALEMARHGDYDTAIDDLSALIATRPNFRLAQLFYGELMAARSGHRFDIEMSEGMRARRDALLAEASARWSHRMTASNAGKVPDVLLQLAPEIEHVIVADLDSNRIYLFANDGGGAPRLVSDFYATIGLDGAGKQIEGDLRTPIGVYRVTRYLDDDQLPELYGVGALPVNYPNALDRARGRTGYGIWLHGVPRTTYARTPRASEGCLVVANDDFDRLRARVNIGETPVIMSNGLNWVSGAELETRRRQIMATVEDWRHSWQSIDTKTYLSYYAPDFVSDAGRDKRAFAAHKREINAAKTHISVDLKQISVFGYPGEANMVKVLFTQEYRSNNYQSRDHKAQYWQQNDDGEWHIVLETEHD